MPRSTIHRILCATIWCASGTARAGRQRFERAHPNELWQMDFKGPKGWPQPVGPLSVFDDHSRYLIALAATEHARRTGARQLEEAFDRGVPDGMLMDHGTPWWNTRAGTADATVAVADAPRDQLHWSGFRHPQTQGKVERFHGSLQRALRRRGFRGTPTGVAGSVSLGT